MPVRSRPTVAGKVRAELPRSVFLPATSRVLWVPFHLLSIIGNAFGVVAAIQGELSLILLPCFSLCIGLSFSGLAFVAHEALHGAIVHNRLLRTLLGWIGFSPFCVAPGLWIAWHNRVHHQNTNIPSKDPDAYPNLAEYCADTHARMAVDLAAPGNSRVRGLITLIIGFSLQATHMLSVAKERNYMKKGEHRIAVLQSLVAAGLWTSLAVFAGPLVFLFVYVLPLIVGNVIVMSYIITNHSLSPLSEKNDALSTSLTVTVPRVIDFFTLGFGYHVEHHLFPSMSNRHGKAVSEVLKRLYPSHYQSLSFGKALKLMFLSPRIYLRNDLLLNPETGERWTTLGPGRVVRRLGDETFQDSIRHEDLKEVNPILIPSSQRPSTFPDSIHPH